MMSTFLLNVPPTEILATPLQYRTIEKFTHNTLSDVPSPNYNPGAAFEHIYKLVDVIVSNVKIRKFLNIHYRNYNVGRKVNYKL